MEKERALVITNPVSIQLLDWVADEWGKKLDGSDKNKKRSLTRIKATRIYNVALRMNKRKKYPLGDVWYVIDTDKMHLFKRTKENMLKGEYAQ